MSAPGVPYQPLDQPQADILPHVGEDRGNRPLWLALGLIIFFGVILLLALESKRTKLTAPAVRPRTIDVSGDPANLPELYVPEEPLLLRAIPPLTVPQQIRQLPGATAPLAPRAQYVPPQPFPNSEPRIVQQQSLPQGPPARTGPAVVYDGGLVASESAGAAGQGGAAPVPVTALPARAHAARTGDQTSVVPQGTLIPAVLETALDSTQPGQARALVTSDVRNSLGTKVLIPKGSRLFGEYRGELGAGQNRAQVQWVRLLRPDNVTIPLDSPAADTLGRSGIKGHVNSFFLQRLGGALLQSTLDIGSLAASRSLSGSSVVVALPSGIQGATSQLVPAAPKPRLRIRQGTRISVFVARDLDFAGVEGGR